MDIEKSYFTVSWFLRAWVRLMEYHTREMEVIESTQLGPGRLVISPPTDAGIPLLVDANYADQTVLLCFSDRLQRVALEYIRKRQIKRLSTIVGPFFQIPAPDESLSAIYANCLFDFCAQEDFDMMLCEIWRVLRPGGILLAVHMVPTPRPGGRLWTWIFRRLALLGIECTPVTIRTNLTRNGFNIRKEMFVSRLGFPLIFSVSEKLVPTT